MRVSRPRRRRLQFSLRTLLALVLLAAVSMAVWTVFIREPDSIREGTWVGWSEGEVVAQLGPPTQSFGQYRRVGRDTPTLPAGPHKTLYYELRDGHLYIWLHRRNGNWTCFDSLWFAEGVEL